MQHVRGAGQQALLPEQGGGGQGHILRVDALHHHLRLSAHGAADDQPVVILQRMLAAQASGSLGKACWALPYRDHGRMPHLLAALLHHAPCYCGV